MLGSVASSIQAKDVQFLSKNEIKMLHEGNEKKKVLQEKNEQLQVPLEKCENQPRNFENSRCGILNAGYQQAKIITKIKAYSIQGNRYKPYSGRKHF